jgi:hypothetical protein
MIKPLKHFLTALIPEHHLWKLELFKKWETIVGKHLKDKIFIEKIDKGVLYLTASHPVWAQELLLLSPLIKEHINAQFSEKKVTAIKFCASPSRTHQPVQQPQKTVSSRPPSPVPQKLNSQEYALLASLRSPELQSAIAAYFIRCKIIQKERR